MKKIKEIREDNDFSQREIAKILKISQQSYSRYETGCGYIPAIHIKELCKFYNVSADYILGLTKDKYPID